MLRGKFIKLGGLAQKLDKCTKFTIASLPLGSELFAIDHISLHKRLLDAKCTLASSPFLASTLIQQCILALHEAVEELKHLAFVLLAAQNPVNHWLKRLAEVEVEVFDEHVGLLSSAVTPIDAAEDIIARAKQSQRAFLQKELLIDLIFLLIDKLSQVADVLEQAEKALNVEVWALSHDLLQQLHRWLVPRGVLQPQ